MENDICSAEAKFKDILPNQIKILQKYHKKIYQEGLLKNIYELQDQLTNRKIQKEKRNN